jgi:hypothetical protein
MKKIINGRLYDTETAKLVGSASYSYPGDFQHWSEDLYLKKTGEFFIHGTGGALSKYSRSAGFNTVTGGEEIISLTTKEAKAWAEKYLEVEEYERIFGEVEE